MTARILAADLGALAGEVPDLDLSRWCAWQQRGRTSSRGSAQGEALAIAAEGQTFVAGVVEIVRQDGRAPDQVIEIAPLPGAQLRRLAGIEQCPGARAPLLFTNHS